MAIGTTGRPATTDAGGPGPVAGGAFLVAATPAGDTSTPERLSAEHRAIREAIAAFVEREVDPRRDALEAKDYATHRELMAILGRDGFLGIDVPAAHGGAGLDKTSSVVATEAMGPAGALAVTYAAHTGIGTLPVVFFGSDRQRERWLPGLADGTTIAAYALTEPSTGSDAQGIRTRATRLEDGRWRLDGTKQFITNAGFADLFTVYAKVDGEAFSAFLVPRDTPGLDVGPEERKLGIHGTSTCPLVLDGAVLEADALLGEVGKGHRVAFNVLNVGRFKLAAAALGAMKPAIATATAYAGERAAFGRPIVRFPAVAAKLGGMAVRTYAVESVVYRGAGLIDARLAGLEDADPEAVKAALEEYAVECSIAKVLASEDLDSVVDELVQVHGGYGYIEDYPAARAYRDSRINRIWEGTNEINRLLVPGTLLKRALAGRLDLLGPARRAQQRLLDGDASEAWPGALAEERSLVEGVRQLTLLLAGAAVQRYGMELEEHQEVLMALADLSIALLATESSVIRAEQAAMELPADRAAIHFDLARAVVAGRVGPAELIARSLAGTVADGDDARMLQAATRRLLRAEPVDAIALGRRVAAAVVDAGRYPV